MAKKKFFEKLEPKEIDRVLAEAEEKEIISEIIDSAEIDPPEANETPTLDPRELFLDTVVEVDNDGFLVLNGRRYGLWETYVRMTPEVRKALFITRGFTFRV